MQSAAYGHMLQPGLDMSLSEVLVGEGLIQVITILLPYRSADRARLVGPF